MEPLHSLNGTWTGGWYGASEMRFVRSYDAVHESLVMLYHPSSFAPVKQPLVVRNNASTFGFLVEGPAPVTLYASKLGIDNAASTNINHATNYMTMSFTPSPFPMPTSPWVPTEVCPRCDKAVAELADYLCEECRYG